MKFGQRLSLRLMLIQRHVSVWGLVPLFHRIIGIAA